MYNYVKYKVPILVLETNLIHQDILKVGEDMSIKYKPILLVESQYDQLFNDGKYEDAIEIMKAFLFENEENPYGKMLAFINIASCYYNLGKIELAFQYILLYKDLSTQYGDEMDKYALYHLYSLIYCSEQNYSKAKECVDKCIKIANKLNLQKELAESSNLLSLIHLFLDNYDVALDYAQQAQLVAYTHCKDDLYLICTIHCNLATTYVYLNQFSQAENIIMLLENNPYIQGNVRERSRLFYCKGILRLKTGLVEEAIQFLQEAMQIAQTLNDKPILKSILKQLANAFEQANIIHHAYLYLKKYVEISDEMQKVQNESKIIQLDTKHNVAQITQRANIDPLSNVYNRYYLEKICNEWLQTARKTKDNICCLAFDVDNFKQINDTYGHLMGDEVIKILGRTCKSIIQGSNALIGRYGGDEFIIILRNYSNEEVHEIAQEIFTGLSNQVICYENHSIQFTISMGIVCNRSIIARKFNQLFRIADQALYMAKNQGKNQIVTLANTNCSL